MALSYNNLAYAAPFISVIIILAILLIFFPVSHNHPNIIVPQSGYNVTFNAVGLPPGTKWGISFNGKQYNSINSQTITLTGVSAGKYSWSTWSISCGSGCEYTPTNLTGTVSVPSQIFETIYFVKQYKINLVTVTHGSPTVPTFSYMDLSLQQKVSLGNESLWVDAGSYWSISPAIIQQSKNLERWAVDHSGGFVVGPQNLTINLYHEFLVTYNILTSDNSLIPSPIYIYGESLGKNFTQTLPAGSSKIWLDSGKYWSVTNVINNSAALERWVTTDNNVGIVNGPFNLTIVYVHQYYLRFLVYPKNSGNINLTDGWYTSGKLAVYAAPTSGYQFDRWYSDKLSVFIPNQYTQDTELIVKGAANISAYFTKSTFGTFPGSSSIARLVALTVVTTTGGTVSYSYGQNTGLIAIGSKTLIIPFATYVCLTANALPGYSFQGWNGTLLGSANPYCFNVNSNMTIQADFSSYSNNNGGGSKGGGSNLQSVPEFPYGSLLITAVSFVLLSIFFKKYKRIIQ